MAHIITIEIGKGFTDTCEVCPFSIDSESDEGFFCGKPEQFPDCDDVNYAEMQVINN